MGGGAINKIKRAYYFYLHLVPSARGGMRELQKEIENALVNILVK